MCGRFALYEPPDAIQDPFDLDGMLDLTPNYNIAPGTGILGIAHFEIALVPMFFRWGLIPHWSKTKQTQYKMINARIEGVWDKPSFRAAIRYRRCLVPASGFYEWEKTGSGKQPHFITVSGSSIFAMAGIWETWEDKSSGEVMDTCAILTTEARGVVRDIHDRMPVIIDREGYKEWLDPMVQTREELNISQIDYDLIRAWPVSTKVNNSRNNNPELVQRAHQ
jgi:putative SOS response-associated peptidase YedK